MIALQVLPSQQRPEHSQLAHLGRGLMPRPFLGLPRDITECHRLIEELQQELLDYKIYCGEAPRDRKQLAHQVWVSRLSIQMRKDVKCGDKGTGASALVAVAMCGVGVAPLQKIAANIRYVGRSKRDYVDNSLFVLISQGRKHLRMLGFQDALINHHGVGYELSTPALEFICSFRGAAQ